MSAPTFDYDRTPDAVITATCDIDQGSFADVDSDGIDDLVVRSGTHVYSWPSSRGPGEPLVWSWSEPGDPGWVDISTPNDGPAWVQWWSFYPDGAYEYDVDASTLALVERGSGLLEWSGFYHVGDVDGDSIPDLVEYPGTDWFNLWVRASSTGDYAVIHGFGDVPTGSYQPYEYLPYLAWSVGDVNQDGYDDLLVAQRADESVKLATDYYDIKQWGPAQLYLGSPTGIQAEPLWTLFAPDHPMAGVGRGAAALPDEGALAVTVVTEGLFYTDFSPELLGVIRDADTPDAYFEELVVVPEFTLGGFTPYLYGWMDDGTGQQALTMMEVSGTTGVQWIPWFADGTGFHPDGSGVALPSRWWSPPGYEVLDPQWSWLSFPVGRHQQALVEGLYTETGYELVEWGRPLDEIGPTLDGVTAAGCTFTASAWPEPEDTGTPPDWTFTMPTTPPDTETTTTSPAPGPPPADDRGCGCDGVGRSGGLAGLLALVLRRTRSRSRFPVGSES